MIDPALRCQPSGATAPMAGRGQFPYSRETIANFAYSTGRRGENGIWIRPFRTNSRGAPTANFSSLIGKLPGRTGNLRESRLTALGTDNAAASASNPRWQLPQDCGSA